MCHATSSSMCHATSTSMCHATSSKLIPQDDVSCHVNIHIMHISSFHVNTKVVDGRQSGRPFNKVLQVVSKRNDRRQWDDGRASTELVRSFIHQ
jgi:hypothetical protein